MAAVIVKVGERFLKEISAFIEDVKADKEKAD